MRENRGRAASCTPPPPPRGNGAPQRGPGPRPGIEPRGSKPLCLLCRASPAAGCQFGGQRALAGWSVHPGTRRSAFRPRLGGSLSSWGTCRRQPVLDFPLITDTSLSPLSCRGEGLGGQRALLGEKAGDTSLPSPPAPPREEQRDPHSLGCPRSHDQSSGSRGNRGVCVVGGGGEKGTGGDGEGQGPRRCTASPEPPGPVPGQATHPQAEEGRAAVHPEAPWMGGGWHGRLGGWQGAMPMSSLSGPPSPPLGLPSGSGHLPRPPGTQAGPPHHSLGLCGGLPAAAAGEGSPRSHRGTIGRSAPHR